MKNSMAMYVPGCGMLLYSEVGESDILPEGERVCKSCGKATINVCEINDELILACEECYLTGKIAKLVKKN